MIMFSLNRWNGSAGTAPKEAYRSAQLRESYRAPDALANQPICDGKSPDFAFAAAAP
jgi:hypothetical protein